VQAAAFSSEGVQHASAASLIKASVGVVVGLGASSSIRIRRLCRAGMLGYFDNSDDMICAYVCIEKLTRSTSHLVGLGVHACNACRVLWAS
jgi:hypothetical protein